MNGMELSELKIRELAVICVSDWKKVNYAAEPYLEAMLSLDTLEDFFICDEGSGVVAYFLANAGGWRGETARTVKKELNKRLDAHYARSGS